MKEESDIINLMVEETFGENVTCLKPTFEGRGDTSVKVDEARHCLILSSGPKNLEIPLNWWKFKNNDFFSDKVEFSLALSDETTHFFDILLEFLGRKVCGLNLSKTESEEFISVNLEYSDSGDEFLLDKVA